MRWNNQSSMLLRTSFASHKALLIIPDRRTVLTTSVCSVTGRERCHVLTFKQCTVYAALVLVHVPPHRPAAALPPPIVVNAMPRPTDRLQKTAGVNMRPVLSAMLVRLGSGDHAYHTFATVSLFPIKSEASTSGKTAVVVSLTTYNILSQAPVCTV